MRICLVCSLVRPEEKMLLEAFHKRGVEVDVVDDRKVVFDLTDLSPWRQYDVCFERTVSQSRARTSSAS